MNVGLGASQADGLSIGNKMNFMSALGEFQAKFGSHDAAATVGGITGDPNLHSPGRLSLVLYSMAGINRRCRFCRDCLECAREKTVYYWLGV
jgi:hypothetical protein